MSELGYSRCPKCLEPFLYYGWIRRANYYMQSTADGAYEHIDCTEHPIQPPSGWVEQVPDAG